MRHESGTDPVAGPGPLDDLLVGEGSLSFVEGDTQVRVGWLRAGGDGLVVTARVDEGVTGQTRFWCDAQQWCDWLAAHLPVPSWDDLPVAWHASAASLTLATQGAGDLSDLDDGGGPTGDASAHTFRDAWRDTDDKTLWPIATSLSRERVETSWRVGMVLQREGRQLALIYLDGASAWLRERCRRATPDDVPLDPAGWPERCCALVAGWVTLPATQYKALHAGDAVLLDVAADIARGEYWLIDGDYAIAMCDGRPSDCHVVQFDDMSGMDRTDSARWDAVVTEKPFPIPLLMAWRAGVPGAAHRPMAPSALHAGRIVLRSRRAVGASGRLMRFEDGRLAVHIDEKSDAPFVHDTPTCDDPPGDISGGDPMGVHPAPT
ncbi:hypothetical protein PI93_004335 [Pandoraea fibrosis]|uniref:Translocation protein in type III secretion n=1 Tax=Pandoraea fibrosis TaxID=1891094 RepID=A0ABX6HM57_9BURK|nr:hypothetical protein [Pandoraea fibrosis]QHE91132.1 hypothetical protein PJ20_004335 [Pandoraea fibrosis]QHF11963.1 hypothetical protein PI93_004335 [Pandoraea fibrosis]